MSEALEPASYSCRWRTAVPLSRATSLPQGLEDLDLGRAGEYWRCPRLLRCFRRIACTMDRSSLPMREEQLVLQAIGQLMSIEDAADFLCIRPTASRKQAKLEAKVLRADLDRFFGDLFNSGLLARAGSWSLVQ